MQRCNLPRRISLNPLIVSLRGTSLPGVPVNTSATWKGWLRNFWILRARDTVSLSSSDSSSIPRIAMISCRDLWSWWWEVIIISCPRQSDHKNIFINVWNVYFINLTQFPYLHTPQHSRDASILLSRTQSQMYYPVTLNRHSTLP